MDAQAATVISAILSAFELSETRLMQFETSDAINMAIITDRLPALRSPTKRLKAIS